jgi:hypothetical protein
MDARIYMQSASKWLQDAINNCAGPNAQRFECSAFQLLIPDPPAMQNTMTFAKSID